MTEAQFNEALRKAQWYIEDALVILADLQDSKHRRLRSDPLPLADAFRAMEEQLRQDYARG